MQLTGGPEETGSNKSDYIKLEEDKPVVGVLRGEPKTLHCVWEEGKKKEVDPSYPGAKWRFKVNMVVNQDGVYTAKILEGGAMIWNQLKELNDEYPLEKHTIKIKRKGTGLETEYTVLPVANGELTEEALQKIGAIELKSL